MIITSKNMRLLEQAVMAGGATALRLMANAGTAAADIIMERYPLREQRAVVLCGRGNNGGDGFVIARRLYEAGNEVTVILCGGQPESTESRQAFAALDFKKLSLVDYTQEPYLAGSAVSGAGLVVDAVYGIGYHGTLSDSLRPLFKMINEQTIPVAAVDVPSGLNCDTGEADADTLCAELTVTFTAEKPALRRADCRKYVGMVVVADVGITREQALPYAEGPTVIMESRVAACFAPRQAESHKGTYGHVLMLGGSYGMAGAALMSAKAALRCGAGLVTAAVPRSIYPVIGGCLPEALFLPLAETPDGHIAQSAQSVLTEQLPRYTAAVIGCGLGQHEQTWQAVSAVLAEASCPIVLDADGINMLAQHISIWKTVKAPVILTPHPAEMARLCRCTTADIQSRRADYAVEFSKTYGATVVLKGHHTVVASPDGQVFVNPTGCPGMATGGSGDVLAGMIGSLAAQGMKPLDAAVCAVYLHGLAGQNASARLSQHGMMPTDMLEELAGLFLKYE